MNDLLILLAHCAIVGLIFGVPITGYVLEHRCWNYGVCQHNGLPWRYFDTDSHGSRGYKAGKHVTWISWSSIDNR